MQRLIKYFEGLESCAIFVLCCYTEEDALYKRLLPKFLKSLTQLSREELSLV